MDLNAVASYVLCSLHALVHSYEYFGEYSTPTTESQQKTDSQVCSPISLLLSSAHETRRDSLALILIGFFVYLEVSCVEI